MEKIIILWLLLGVYSIGHTQVVTVKDKETSRPLELVSLASNNPKVFVMTNVRGQADISALKGAELIEIRLLGYQTVKMSYAAIIEAELTILLNTEDMSLDEIVVSATRWNQSRRDIPGKITAVTAKEVALLNPQTAADLLGASGEVFIQKSQQGGGSPMIRGFSTNRLLYTIDGVRMNTAIFRGGNIQNIISLDPFAIEGTEVLFGPGSVIYGSDAIGGVMSFQTLTPSFSTSDKPLVTGKVVMRHSSANNEKTGHFDIDIGWEKWAAVTSFTSSDFGDLKMGSKGPDEYLKTFYVQRIDGVDRVVANDNPKIQRPTGYAQINMMQKVRFKPNEKWDFQYGFHYSETSEYSRYDRLIEVLPNGLPRSAVWNYGPQKWMMNHLTIAHTGKSILYDRFNIRVAQQYFEESRIDRNFSGGQRFRLRNQMEQVNAYSINADFEKLKGSHKFFYGLEAIRNEVMSSASATNIQTGAAIPVSPRYPGSTWDSYSAYLNYQYRVSEKVLLQSGVRYSHYLIQADFSQHLAFFPFDFTTVEVNNNAVNGSVGVVYTPSEKWTVSANASTGFRAPNVDDIGKMFDFQAGSVIVPNSQLAAEYAYNGEINLAKVFGKVAKIDFSGFYTQLDNALVRRAFQVSGQDSMLYNGEMSQIFAIQNAAFANVYGFHAGIEVKLPAGFGIVSKFNYQLGVEEMEDGTISRSRHAAPWYGVTRLTYKADKLTMQLYLMYSGEVSYENLNEEERQKPIIYAKDEKGNPYSPGWYTFNYKVMYQFVENFSVSAGLENITDQRYRPYSSGLVAAGRNFVLSLRANF